MAQDVAAGGKAWELREQIAADVATMGQRNAEVYVNDARYAYQVRLVQVDVREALAFQTANSSLVAKDAMHLNLAPRVPKS